MPKKAHGPSTVINKKATKKKAQKGKKGPVVGMSAIYLGSDERFQRYSQVIGK